MSDSEPILYAPLLRIGPAPLGVRAAVDLTSHGAGAERVSLDGFADAEPNGSWTNGPDASLVFAIDPSCSEDVAVNLEVSAFVSNPKVPRQVVDVAVNGSPSAIWEISDGQWHERSVVVPLSIHGGGVPVRVTFSIAGCRAPVELGINPDTRLLGICLRRFTLTSVSRPIGLHESALAATIGGPYSDKHAHQKGGAVRDIDAYWRGGFHAVEGWVFAELVDYLKAVNRFQEEARVVGNIAEIGVHHGKLLIALTHLARPGEKCVAIDLFADQAANVDGSGHGDLDKFQGNVSSFASPDTKLVCIQADSLGLSGTERVAIAKDHGPFRIFSIDGGHTVEHTFNDLMLAQDMLGSGGVIVLDDYYNQHWPGVHEGVGHFYLHSVPRVKPFLYAHNKLFFAGLAFHARYLRWCCDTFRERRGFKMVKMYGADAMVVA